MASGHQGVRCYVKVLESERAVGIARSPLRQFRLFLAIAVTGVH